MPMSEYIGWQEFYAVEPWGLAVQDALQANGAALFANVNRDTKKRAAPFLPKDFLVFQDPGDREESRPVLLADADDQSELVIAQFAGMTVIRADMPLQ